MAASNPPQSVRIARKRGAEVPPSTLVIESQEGESNAVYVRQHNGDGAKRRDVSKRVFGDHEAQQEVKFAAPTGARNELARKLFEFKRSTQDGSTGQSKRGRDEVATFVAQRKGKSARRSNGRSGAGQEDGGDGDVHQDAAPARPFKRPSRQPRAKGGEGEQGVSRPQTQAEQRDMEELARYLHEAALDEVQREQKVKRETPTRPMAKVVPPQISGQRAKELHRQRVESNRQRSAHRERAEDVGMSNGDYIYDTYVLVHAPSTADFHTHSDVGYLVIAPEDQDCWEAYVDDLPSSDDGQDSDDVDENAEDYYGADYPEDELSEDDEFGRKSYWKGGEESGEEGYESDDAGCSDDEEGEKLDRMMNPFKYRGPRLRGVVGRLEGRGAR